MNQIDYYQAKLDFEIDSADLFAALNANSEDLVVVDARSSAAYAIEYIPTAKASLTGPYPTPMCVVLTATSYTFATAMA